MGRKLFWWRIKRERERETRIFRNREIDDDDDDEDKFFFSSIRRELSIVDYRVSF